MLLFFIILLLSFGLKKTGKSAVSVRDHGLVVKIIDSDTIKLDNGKIVRLIGINGPEKGEKCYEEAVRRLKELIEDKEITLERDVDNSDTYGRLLRYVFLNDTFINQELVKDGLAVVYIVGNNKKYEAKLKESEMKAIRTGGCMWKTKENTCSGCIKIVKFNWNAKGNDCNNLNDEYIVFRNSCNFSCNLTGWKVRDSGHIYKFHDFIVEGNSVFTLYTGIGNDTKTELYWNNKGKKCNAIWNNNGDTLYLRDLEGNIMLIHNYTSY